VLPDALGKFVGTILQRPPAFSARKQEGRTAYRAARAGTPLVLPERPVRIDAIELLTVTAGPDVLDVAVDVRCGPGTYIRALARDLGETLGCGGYLHALRRTEAAGLRVADALDPPALERLATEDRLAEAVIPVATLLPLPHLDLDPTAADRFRHGSLVAVAAGTDPGRHAVLHDGELLGVGSVAGGMLQPEKVVAEVPG
jgi:tRNA pseudouridine55 synthase